VPTTNVGSLVAFSSCWLCSNEPSIILFFAAAVRVLGGWVYGKNNHHLLYLKFMPVVK
jgi:hypothetical protein